MVRHTLLRQSLGLKPGRRSTRKAANGSAQIVAPRVELRGTACHHARPEGMSSTRFRRGDIADNSAQHPIASWEELSNRDTMSESKSQQNFSSFRQGTDNMRFKPSLLLPRPSLSIPSNPLQFLCFCLPVVFGKPFAGLKQLEADL